MRFRDYRPRAAKGAAPCGYRKAITRRFGNQPAYELRQDQAVSTASFALIASTAGFNSAETPGIASTLSNS